MLILRDKLRLELERQCFEVAAEYGRPESWLSRGLGRSMGRHLDQNLSIVSLYANLEPTEMQVTIFKTSISTHKLFKRSYAVLPLSLSDQHGQPGSVICHGRQLLPLAAVAMLCWWASDLLSLILIAYSNGNFTTTKVQRVNSNLPICSLQR